MRMWYLSEVAESYTLGHSFSRHYIMTYLREIAWRATHSDVGSFSASASRIQVNVPSATVLRAAFRADPVWTAELGTPLWSL
jgi:hypothetical protein